MITEIAPNFFDLGTWKPDIEKYLRPGFPFDCTELCRLWEKTLRRRLGLRALCPSNSEFRLPYRHTYGALQSAVLQWHKDCGMSETFLIVWANLHPTDVRPDRLSGGPMPLLASHIYAFWNRAYLHRTPYAAIEAPRCFARAYYRPEGIWPHDLRSSAEPDRRGCPSLEVAARRLQGSGLG